MNILSFTFWDGCHDTSAALVCDGTLIAAAEEERFSRRKHEERFPHAAIEYCLQHAGLRMADIAILAFPDKPFWSGVDSQLADAEAVTIAELVRAGKLRARSLLHKRLLDAALRSRLRFNWGATRSFTTALAALRRRFGELPPARFYDHHRAHAAAAYFTSSFERAAIVTVDGRGGTHSTVTWRAEGTRLTRLRSQPYTNSLGLFYLDVTNYLGLGAWGEGKTMGLAAYGDPRALIAPVREMLELQNGAWYRYRQPPRREILGFPSRTSEALPVAPYADLAAASQAALQSAMGRVVESAMQEANCRDLCLGGGVALNCSNNGTLLAAGVAERLWVFAASGDAGTPVGAALLCAAETGELRRQHIQSAAVGPGFTTRECEEALRAEPRVEFERPAELCGRVANELAAGQVVGWFDGRMELGPRALGHRSILADPRSPAMRDRVNHIKGREPWRPLAPVLALQRSAEFFEPAVSSPFMLFALPVRPEKRGVIPAVVHVDGTARPQTVSPDLNPRLCELLSHFERLHGVPVLLNTSFNCAGEPIVCTPRDAIRTFLSAGLDGLVLGDFLVRRRKDA